MLWLALHFPGLLLESLAERRSPAVIVTRGRVLAADAGAAAAGVRPGQKLATALGLCPGLLAREREPAREVRALDELACWAGRFTPTVVQRPPQALLLEIGGCQRLFGGLEALLAQLDTGAGELGWTLHRALAPTPLAALWLARAGSTCVPLTTDELRAALATLPCSVPDWPGEVVERLRAYGVDTLAGVFRLPADGLRRRLGNGPVEELARALGELPDPQRPFVFPERYAAELELPARVEHADGLAFAAQRLLAGMGGWLQARQLLLRVATLHLGHDDGRTTPLPLRLGEASADEGRLLRLLREHLGRLTLAAPVETLRLTADEVQARPDDSRDLFAAAPAGEGRVACLERLRARLGEAAVQVLGEHADHRPECATTSHDAVAGAVEKIGQKTASTAGFSPPRPLWLLAAPQALGERPDGPHWHGPLHFLTRPERIESGWWDSGESGAAGDQRRDYFVVRNAQGQHAWIYRDAGGWYLHGLFA